MTRSRSRKRAADKKQDEQPEVEVAPQVEEPIVDEPEVQEVRMADEAAVRNVMADYFEGLARENQGMCPPFDGSGNVTHWLLSYALATDGKDEPTKLRMLIKSMKGQAYTWFCSTKMADMSAGVNATSAMWTERLKAFYGKTPGQSLDELEGRKQRENEDAVAYVRDMLRLCGEVEPGMAEATKLRHLQRGLLPRFSRDMLLMDPSDTATFQTKLVKLMSSAPAADMSNPAFFASLVASAMKEKEAPVLAAQAVAPLDAIVETMKSLQLSQQTLTQELKSLKQKQNQPQSGYRKARVNNGNCYNCNEPGHIAKFCPVPKMARDPPAGQQAGNDGHRS